MTLCINHDILLDKLKYCGIRGVAHDWFESYLNKHQQCVKFNNCLSDLKCICCGVPQGSLLGPLLFLIYINDILKSSKLLSFILYADDTSIFYCKKNLTSLFEIVNKELANTFKANRLSLNLLKCKYMIFCNRKGDNLHNLNNELDGTSVQRFNKFKFLGVFIDEKLIWNFHIEETVSKVSKSIGVISRLKHLLFPLKYLKPFIAHKYFPIFRIVILYGEIRSVQI